MCVHVCAHAGCVWGVRMQGVCVQSMCVCAPEYVHVHTCGGCVCGVCACACEYVHECAHVCVCVCTHSCTVGGGDRMFLNFLGASLGETAAPPPTQSRLSLHSRLPDLSAAHHDPALPPNSWCSVQGPRRRWPGTSVFTDRPSTDTRTVRGNRLAQKKYSNLKLLTD